MTAVLNLSPAAHPVHVSSCWTGINRCSEFVDGYASIRTKVLALDLAPLPSSLLGAAVFFGLLVMIGWLLIRETLRIVLKPVLIFVLLALLAVWAGILDGTVVEQALSWIGDRLILILTAVSGWAVGVFEAAASGSTSTGS